jgi:hypothetical protein
MLWERINISDEREKVAETPECLLKMTCGTYSIREKYTCSHSGRYIGNPISQKSDFATGSLTYLS